MSMKKASKRGGVIWLVAGVIMMAGAVVLFATRATNVPEFDTGAEYSGVASGGGLVVDGAEIALGEVPLNITVTPTWTLVNDSAQVVSLGEPHATVVEGCCPGPLTLSATSLAPGESAELTFPLQMHEGMDGPHQFDVHVPVGVGDEFLTLGVTGDFG